MNKTNAFRINVIKVMVTSQNCVFKNPRIPHFRCIPNDKQLQAQHAFTQGDFSCA